MSQDFLNCIVEAAANGEIDKDVAEELKESYDAAHASFSETFGPVDADRMAGKAVLTALEFAARESRRHRKMMFRLRRAYLFNTRLYKLSRGYLGVPPLQKARAGGAPGKGGFIQGGTPPANGSYKAASARMLELIVENKPGLSGSTSPSVAGRYDFHRGKVDALMADIIEKFETKTGFDKPRRALLKNVVREAFGEDTGDQAAKALAQAWLGAAEHLRLKFNAAGGSIGKIARWGMPQVHDAAAVREVGKDAWVASITPRLDAGQMIDRATGRPFTPARLKAVLEKTWERIATGGAVDRQPGSHMGVGMLAKQRGEERFLVFKDAENWMAYQQEFGEGDAYAAMMGHLDGMARDIAQMEILGPNPQHQFEWLKRFAEREAQIEEMKGAKGAVKKAASYAQTATDMLAHFNGTASLPVNETFAQIGVTTRSALTGFALGSTIVSDMPSAPYFGAMARKFSGLSATGDMLEFNRLLISPERRKFARRSGFIIEQATDGFVSGAQDNLRLMSVGAKAQGGANAFARRLPAAILRLQGLTPYVAARKRAFRFEFMGALHDRRGMTIAAMKASKSGEDQVFGKWLEARGFTEGDWQIIAAAPVWTPSPGSSFLRPTDVAHPELAARLGEGIQMETRFASPETTLWTRAKLLGQSRPGTLWGEFKRSVAMFHSFTVTATHLYAEEMALRGKRGSWQATALATGGSAASALIYLTLAGAAAMQLREIVKGNDPKPLVNPDGKPSYSFWTAAMAQGGGEGILGDFFQATTARNGKTAPATAFGPVGSFAADTVDLTAGNVGEVMTGMDKGKDFGHALAAAHPGRDAAGYAAKYAPPSTLWWGRALWARTVVDNLQRQLDPGAEEAFARKRKKREREMHQGQWWPDGSTLPERAPQLVAPAAP